MVKSFGMKPVKVVTSSPWLSPQDMGVSYTNPLSGKSLTPPDRSKTQPVKLQRKDTAPQNAPVEDAAQKETTAQKDGAASNSRSATAESLIGTEGATTQKESASVLAITTEQASSEEQSASEKRRAAQEAAISSDDELYLPLRDYCIRGLGASCNRCQMACPMQAISFGEDDYPQVDLDLCTRCGICSGICDGFTSTRVTLEDLHTRIMRVTTYADQVVLTCDENIFSDTNPADNVVVIPCLAAIPPELYTLLLAQGVNLAIACNFEYCASCFRAPGYGETLYTAAISLAETWSGVTVGILDAVPQAGDFMKKAANEGAGRRELFENLFNSGQDVASGNYRRRKSKELQEFYAMQERMRASVAASLSNDTSLHPANASLRKRMFPHRELLLDAANASAELGQRVPVTVSATDAGACCQSLTCVEKCPTQARHADQFGNLAFDQQFCVGCGLCVSACPQGACSLIQKTLATLDEPCTFGTRTAADLPAPASERLAPVVKTLTDADQN